MRVLRPLIGIMMMWNATALADGGLTLAWDNEPRTIDPRYATDANSQYLENLVHCSIVDFDKKGNTVNDLATDIMWTSPTTVSVSINAKAKFSDGSAVAPADVKATYEFFQKEDVKDPSPRKGAFANLDSIRVDKSNVIFKLKEPDSTFTGNLVVGILPKKLAEGGMLSEAKDVIGCGPFALTEKSVSGLKLEANKHYGLGPKAKVTSLEIKVVKDESTRFAKLRRGEVDIVQNGISRDTLETIGKKYPDLKVIKRPGLNTAYLGFNMRDKIVGNVKVRQAISHAIDREKIIKFILRGFAVPAKTLITPDDPYFNDSLKGTTYDPELAKKLLDEAGFKDPDGKGKQPRFKLVYKTTTDITRVALAKAIAADLRKIGIDVAVQPLEWGRFKADVEAGKVQMWSLKWVGFKDPDIFRYVFSTESFPPNGGNRGWYSNKELDKLMADAKTTTETKKRRELYEEVQKIVDTELPYVFLWHEEVFAVINKKVEGFEVYADGRFGALPKTYKR